MNIIMVRPAAGVIAANLLLASIVVATPTPFWWVALYAIGWGLALLLGVMSRYLARQLRGGDLPTEGTWSGVLIASLAWQGATTSFFFPEHWQEVLDLSVLPLALVYVGSKIGCLHLGCCGWRRRVPLQLVEIGWTLTVAGLAWLFPAPPGVSFCAFLSLHFIGWQVCKALRGMGADAPAAFR